MVDLTPIEQLEKTIFILFFFDFTYYNTSTNIAFKDDY